MITKIVNIFGGPGAGKSTTCYGVVYELRKAGVEVEFVSEWIKDKVYEGTAYPFNDQQYTHAKQRKKIRQMLGKVKFIVTDSPLPLSVVYGEHELPEFINYVLKDFKTYDNVNYLVTRDHPYSNVGRHQTEAEALEVHETVKKLLDDEHLDYVDVLSSTAVDDIVADVLKLIK